MKIFSIELSTVRASVGIYDGERVLAEASWMEPMARHQRLFDEVPGLLERAGLGWDKIDLFAVGRGPGAFSGIRIGLMAAQMYAAPLGKKVVAVSSGEALASSFAKPVVVCGDARRGMFWYGVFTESFSGWLLSDAAAFAGKIPAYALVVTPHWMQTEPLRSANPALRWQEGDQFPTAHAVARLSLAKESSEPLEPIYLHPPV